MNNKSVPLTPVKNVGPAIENLLGPCGCQALATREADLAVGLSKGGATSALVPPQNTRASATRIRNGKIARLPKLDRDMVNRMLHNNIPHKKIVGALDELRIYVTERNISNWKTRGGYQEWRVEQERQINLSRLQDNLIDYLRKNDATQLPEVGLQVASTQLSLVLLQPNTAQQLAAQPEKYRQVVEMLCRLATQIQSLQKDRDDAVRKAAIRDTPECIKREDEKSIEQLRLTYSAAKLAETIKEYDTPHRNELPKRDELPFREPPAKAPSIPDIMQFLQQQRTSPAGPGPVRTSQ